MPLELDVYLFGSILKKAQKNKFIRFCNQLSYFLQAL